MKHTLIATALILGSALATPAMADDATTGAIVGGGAGAIVGHAMGGRNGALAGGVLGAVVGASVASKPAYAHGSRTYRHDVNATVVYEDEPPVVYAPPPVYVEPEVVTYAPPPVYVRTYYGPPGYYVRRGWDHDGDWRWRHHEWHEHHGWHHHDDDD